MGNWSVCSLSVHTEGVSFECGHTAVPAGLCTPLRCVQGSCPARASATRVACYHYISACKDVVRYRAARPLRNYKTKLRYS